MEEGERAEGEHMESLRRPAVFSSQQLLNCAPNSHLVVCIRKPKADDFIQDVAVEDEPGLQVSRAVGAGCFIVCIQAWLQSDKGCLKDTQLGENLPMDSLHTAIHEETIAIWPIHEMTVFIHIAIHDVAVFTLSLMRWQSSHCHSWGDHRHMAHSWNDSLYSHCHSWRGSLHTVIDEVTVFTLPFMRRQSSYSPFTRW